MKVKFDFDPVADAAYIRINNSRIVESEEVSPGVVYDFDKDDQVVGIEILKLKHRTPEQLKELSTRSDSPLTAEHKAAFKEFFKLERYAL